MPDAPAPDWQAMWAAVARARAAAVARGAGVVAERAGGRPGRHGGAVVASGEVTAADGRGARPVPPDGAGDVEVAKGAPEAEAPVQAQPLTAGEAAELHSDLAAERLAIMTIDGGLSEAEALAYVRRVYGASSEGGLV